MRRVRVLLAGLTMVGVLSGCAASPLLPILLIQEERERLLLAEKSPVPVFDQVVRSNHSAKQAAAWAMLPHGSVP